MKTLVFSVFAICCALVGASIAASAGGDYEIIDGNCISALARDMAYHEHVHKTRLPLVSREAKVSIAWLSLEIVVYLFQT